ncbi:hypothetical protein [Wenyingzhuangia sp. 2_MG-2023]|uniref:acyltransferase n=1 Tax=Wenyingzhuangia sp. 2_MG-2023 TaxID=3062639 RepID=UPI0026E2EE00|nr:hypothetical protein [Wenyingzhuangia sp. 2_MG-2023]MDO6739089.1 hypothetical protein [Wenyingzhuangia sp. 2_MG-2023]
MILKLKNRMKQARNLLLLVSKIHNIINFNNSWKYRIKNNIKLEGSFLKKTKFNIKGHNNTVIIGEKARLTNCEIVIIGNNCKIEIGTGSTIISNTVLWCQDDNSTINIGNDFTMEGGHIASTEGELIRIGNDCMFSGEIEIRNGDSHSMVDNLTKQRLNHAKPVFIGNHVWLTANVKVLKGASIPSNSIIGNSSIVSKKLCCENAVYAGIPCKIVKENMNWDRQKL